MKKASLLLHCSDREGLVAKLSDFVFHAGGSIVDVDQYSDSDEDEFFIRLVWNRGSFQLDEASASKKVAELIPDASYQLKFHEAKPKAAVFVTQTAHCLYDLLHTQELGELPAEIALVISNREELKSVAEHFGVPFFWVPVKPDKKMDAEIQQLKLLDDFSIDLVVLARYMQIVSPQFIDELGGQVINIHHSFLPSFVGAKPYHQAKERGVKLIGATAHFVTPKLDDGPIIDQEVVAVSHRDSIKDLVAKGRDLERRVLTRAVKLHLDYRVLRYKNRTVVFS